MKKANLLKLPSLRAKPPRSPKGLGTAGRRLWTGIQREYSITDAGGIAHLMSACRAEDDLERLRNQVRREGDTITVTGKPPIAHPLLASIRGLETVKRQALRSLNLDLEPLRDRVGRPAGR